MANTDRVNIVPTPQMVFVPPQPIKIFQVTEEKLQAIKTAANDSSQDLSFMVGSLGIFFTALTTLLTATTLLWQSFVIYVVVTCATLIVALYTGIQWLRKRKIFPRLIESITKAA